jgi:TLD
VEGGRRECVMSGVVVDRVFDGIVAFTSGRDRMVNGTSALTSIPSASKDYEIVSCAEAVEELGVEGVVATVASQYSAMTVEGVQGDQVRIVSVTSTLDCVRRMLEPHVAAALDAAAATTSEDLFDAFARSDAAKRPADEPDGGPRVVRAASEPARAVASGSADLLTPRLSHASICMPDACFAKLISAAPVRYHESDLQRLYCTNTDGISLATLLSKVSGRSPIFIVVRDTSNRAFGCYGSTSWRNSCTLMAWIILLCCDFTVHLLLL